jgi:hypothetical protein
VQLKFSSFLIQIFKVLQVFETVAARCVKYSADYYNKLETELRKIGFLKSILCGVNFFKNFFSLLFQNFNNSLFKKKTSKPVDAIDENDLNKDAASNFILRLAFCNK